MAWRTNLSLGAIVAISLALTSGLYPVRAEVIGNATQARNEVTGKLGTVVQTIRVGTNVSARELVRTGPGSATALRFVDGSNLDIGEGSEVVLDTFVFDPNGPDDVVVNVTKGALRFVSAGVGPHRATVKMPNALLGIRGTDVITWCAETAPGVVEECATLVDTGRVRVCPYDVNRAVDLDALRRACDEGDESALPCGYYELAGREEQENDKEGNFLWWQPGCVVGTPANLPSSAFQSLQAQIAAGLPTTLPTQLAALVVPGINIGPIIVIGAGVIVGAGVIINEATQNNDDNGPVTGQ